MMPKSFQLSCAVLAALAVLIGDCGRADDEDVVLKAESGQFKEKRQAEQSVRKQAGLNGHETFKREQGGHRQHDVARPSGLKNKAVQSHKVRLTHDLSRADPNVCVLGGGDKPLETISKPLGSYIAEQGWNLVTGNLNRGSLPSVREAFKKTAEHTGKSIQYYAPKDNQKDEKFADEFVEQDPKDGAAKIKICVVVVALPGGPGTAKEIDAAKEQKLPVAAFLTENEMATVDGKEVNVNAVVKKKMEEPDVGELFMENEFDKLKEFLSKHMKDVSSSPGTDEDKPDSTDKDKPDGTDKEKPDGADKDSPDGGNDDDSGANLNVRVSFSVLVVVVGSVFARSAFL